MTLHYFFDPLCGWCYGFAPIIENFFEAHKSEMDIEVTSGGMVKGENEKPIGDMAPYLKGAYKKVEDTSGVKFGEQFLANLDIGTMFYSSVPSSVALAVFRSYLTGYDLEYAGALQSAIYFDGVDPVDIEYFANLAEKYDLDSDEFLSKMKLDEFKKEAFDDFSVTQQFGVTGYPTVVLHVRDEYFLLSKGFTNLENLEKTYASILNSVG